MFIDFPVYTIGCVHDALIADVSANIFVDLVHVKDTALVDSIGILTDLCAFVFILMF